jgi:hypothetical protein
MFDVEPWRRLDGETGASPIPHHGEESQQGNICGTQHFLADGQVSCLATSGEVLSKQPHRTFDGRTD